MTEKSHSLDIQNDFLAPEFSITPIPSSKLKNGIIVRLPNWLGDIIMTLPALHQIKLMLPKNCALAVMAPVAMRPLINSLPWVDVFIPLENTHKNWSAKEKKRVKRFAAGVAVLFNNSLRDTLMFRLCSVPRLYGAAMRCRSIFMTRSFRFPKRISGKLNLMHHTNRYLAMAYAIGAPKWNGVMPEIVIAEPFFQQRDLIRSLCDHPKVMILAAGAAYGAAKRWSSENYNDIAKRWIEQNGIVISVGSKSEMPIGEEISKNLDSKHYFNMMGRTSLCELMYMLKHAAIVIANDSGVMHLATALGSEGVAIFGSTDYSATGPISPDWKVIYDKQSCSPCFQRACPKSNPICMKTNTPDDVWGVINQFCQTHRLP